MTNCETCRWFDGSPDLLGHCHKNPPLIFGKPDEEYVSDFPEVDPEDQKYLHKFSSSFFAEN
jgi:hypothetical protein